MGLPCATTAHPIKGFLHVFYRNTNPAKSMYDWYKASYPYDDNGLPFMDSYSTYTDYLKYLF